MQGEKKERYMLKDKCGKGMHKMKRCQCEIVDAFPFFKIFINILFL